VMLSVRTTHHYTISNRSCRGQSRYATYLIQRAWHIPRGVTCYTSYSAILR